MFVASERTPAARVERRPFILVVVTRRVPPPAFSFLIGLITMVWKEIGHVSLWDQKDRILIDLISPTTTTPIVILKHLGNFYGLDAICPHSGIFQD